MSPLLLVALAAAVVPMPPWPECGEPDRPDLCPPDLGESWSLLSYVPQRYRALTRPQELEMGTGLWADRAWRTTPGRTDVLIAVLDSGMQWDSSRLVRKHFLHRGELPLPQGASDHDADGNGVFNMDDWAGDPRVSPDAGVDVADSLLDPSDLIAVFSDGVDDDGNGYVDDISGWDFLWDDNNPYDDTRYGHGTGEAEDSTEEGGDGDSIGVCPNCMVLSVRTGDSYITDGPRFGLGVLYAVDMGASVVQEALGALTNPAFVQVALDYAWERGVTVVGSAADETAWHPNYPGANPHTVFVHAVRYDQDDRDQATTWLAYSNCTNHGARLDLSAPSTSCSSGATGVTSGVAGLLHSAARDVGITLTANESWQLMVGTADDIWVEESATSDTVYPSEEGWDRYFGQGRVNAHRIVEQVRAGRIPPEADFHSPSWFQYVDPERTPTLEIRGLARADRGTLARWTLSVAPGLDPAPSEFQVIATGVEPVDGLLASWEPASLGHDATGTLAPYQKGMDQVDREEAVNLHTVSLRLAVEDTEGNVGMARRALTLHHDPDLLEGWPLDLGTSLESSPQLFDLDGDGAREVIQADSMGRIHALKADGSQVPGWPVSVPLLPAVDPSSPAHHLDAPAWDVVDPVVRSTLTATPAVADLEGDGAVEVVAATLVGDLLVYGADGTLRSGFPVRQQDVGFTDPDHILDVGFFGAPALGDLDGDGDLEMVVGGMDQQVYAWHHDGAPLEGWPVLVRHPAYGDHGARILSSPALGDLDGDGLEDVVLGTNETLDGGHSALYAVSGTGQVLPGWPVDFYCMESDILPFVGEGMPTSPVLGDLDGDGSLEVVSHGLGGSILALAADGTEKVRPAVTSDAYGSASNANDILFLPLANSPSLGDLDGDGTLDIVDGGVGMGYAEGQFDDGIRYAFDHFLGAWSGKDGDFLRGFPQVLEDLQFFMEPALADIDGDGALEAITGSGGFVLHAWNEEGAQPEGWPKLTGHWILSSPAVGDVDGDGFLEVVAATRDGRLHAWRTLSTLEAPVAWSTHRHDPRNTGNYHTPVPVYETSHDTGVAQEKSCGCVTSSRMASAPWWVLLALAARRRRGRS